MPPSSYRTPFLFMVLLALILTYHPIPVSSSPIVIFQDRNSHASTSSYINDQLVFDASFTFILLIASLITCIWIRFRMTIDLFFSWIIHLLGVSIAVAEQVVEQLSYFSFDNVVTVITSILIDANDLRRDFTRPTGELENPISTTTPSAPSSQRPARVIQPDMV